jgi:hypothetical protein
MRTAFLLMLGIFIWSAMSWAQVPAVPAAAAETQLPSGTVLSAELSVGLDTKKCKADDKIRAKAVADLLVHGQIVVPRNTEITGHVTEAKAHSKSSPGSTVGVVFDHMLLKDGREVPLQVTVQAIAKPLPTYGNELDSSADIATMPQMPRGGTLVPGRGPSFSQTPTPKSPNNLPDPASTNPSGTVTANPNSLDVTSRGVFGIKGLSLDTSGPVSILSSSTGNVHLDARTQLTLRVQ